MQQQQEFRKENFFQRIITLLACPSHPKKIVQQSLDIAITDCFDRPTCGKNLVRTLVMMISSKIGRSRHSTTRSVMFFAWSWYTANGTTDIALVVVLSERKVTQGKMRQKQNKRCRSDREDSRNHVPFAEAFGEYLDPCGPLDR